MKPYLAAVVASASLAALGGGYSNGAIEHVKPMNLFPSGGEVSFAVKPGKDAEKGFVATDYYGNVVPATYDREGGRLRLGKLAPGYYVIDNGGVGFQDAGFLACGQEPRIHEPLVRGRGAFPSAPRRRHLRPARRAAEAVPRLRGAVS